MVCKSNKKRGIKLGLQNSFSKSDDIQKDLHFTIRQIYINTSPFGYCLRIFQDKGLFNLLLINRPSDLFLKAKSLNHNDVFYVIIHGLDNIVI